METLVCVLCDKEITDIEAGGFIPVFGEACGNCIDEIKKVNPNFTKEGN